ncbi:MAG: 50S ribosomal protein L4 [Fidelibacterota bacterium]
MDLSDQVFAYPLKPHLIYEAVCHYRAEGRAGTHSTKNRSVVSGGGRKPWRQKKTGRARAGSIRSPLWRGGGTVHGPVPRSYGYAFPRRMRWNALRSVLSQKVREERFMVVEDLKVKSPRTQDLLAILGFLGLEKTKTLLVDENENRELFLASRNLQRVHAVRAMGLSAYHVLDHDTVVASTAAVQQLQEWLGK